MATERDTESFEWNDGKENVIEWTIGSSTASCTVSQRRLITRLKKLAEDYPDEVQILHENTDGTIFAHVPLKYVSIRKPRQVDMSEEQKDVLRERLQNLRNNRLSSEE